MWLFTKNTGVGSLSLLQQIFPIQESNWGLLHCRRILYQLNYQGSPQYKFRLIVIEKSYKFSPLVSQTTFQLLNSHMWLQFSSVTQSCLTLWDPMNHSTPGLPVHHQFPEPTQTHVHCVSDAIQPSHPLLSPSPPALNLSQHQGLFKWVSSSNQVTKVLEFQLQHQSFQWTHVGSDYLLDTQI